jgi:hypothetical protein
MMHCVDVSLSLSNLTQSKYMRNEEERRLTNRHVRLLSYSRSSYRRLLTPMRSKTLDVVFLIST